MRAGVSPVPIDADAREEGRYRAHASPHVRRPQRSTRALEHEGGPMRRSPCSSVNGLFACASVSGMVCLLVRACVGFSGAGGSPPQPGTGPTTHQPAAATAAPNAGGSASLCVRACAACACERDTLVGRATLSIASPGTTWWIVMLSIASPGPTWWIVMLSIASPGTMWWIVMLSIASPAAMHAAAVIAHMPVFWYLRFRPGT